ncbi:MAG: DUF4924 family protein [Bacteroidaceae bacterium]|nr:DUF4924 family protein [Bacteroidaceae bacterium]
MFIAQQLKQTNIIEYVLYLWQVEDIVRAYDCSLPRLRREYISRFEYDAEQLDELTDWYAMLIKQMNDEGCREHGHLQAVTCITDHLEQLHLQLANDASQPFYKAQYYKVLPFIVELRNKGSKNQSEVITCLNALYGTMMLRLQHKDISPDTKHAVEEIATLMGMLSDEYAKKQ